MATQQSFLVYDNSTLANLKSWAQTISSFFTTAGWVQSTDTGQVNWGTNVSVPGSGAFVYEIWKPNDGLTNFYFKVEYGNTTGTNSPGLRLSISETTNGSGTLTGSILGPYLTQPSGVTPASSSTTYECDFSGVAGRMGAVMWRTAASGKSQLFAIERSLNSSGAYTGTYVTLYVWGDSASAKTGGQATLYFGGPGVIGWGTQGGSSRSGSWSTRNQTNASMSFNGVTCFDTATPVPGFFDYAGTEVGIGFATDITEGSLSTLPCMDRPEPTCLLRTSPPTIQSVGLLR